MRACASSIEASIWAMLACAWRKLASAPSSSALVASPVSWSDWSRSYWSRALISPASAPLSEASWRLTPARALSSPAIRSCGSRRTTTSPFSTRSPSRNGSAITFALTCDEICTLVLGSIEPGADTVRFRSPSSAAWRRTIVPRSSSGGPPRYCCPIGVWARP